MTILSNNYALLNVSVVDGFGGDPVDDMFVRVIGHRIDRVAPMKEYRRKSEAQELSLDGHYVMPGLIDAHVHLAGGRADLEWQELEVFMEPKLLRGMRSVYESQKLLKRGFTSVRDISWNGLYLKRIFSDGILPGPRIIACGPGLTRTGGHGDAFQYHENFVKQEHFWSVLADGPEEIRKAVRRILREGADQIKIWASGGDNWPHERNSDTHYTLEEVKMCVEEARMIKGTLCCAHVENNESLRICIEAGVDTIEHGECLDEECAEAMVRKNMILVPTMGILLRWFTEFCPPAEESAAQPKRIRPDAFLYREFDSKPDADYGKRFVKKVQDSFALAKEKGVKIALGSDTIFEPLTEYGEYSMLEFKYLVSSGLTVPEAIKAGTLTSAEALGMSHRIGTVEAGKNADLLIVRKDPTKDPEVLYNADHLRMVILNGRLAVEEGRFAY
ncbi:MAG: amidohydrolase family protein [Eubacteriales bacterium]|nr:amidohydrolase family protein [Eubacteriales bacterium]